MKFSATRLVCSSAFRSRAAWCSQHRDELLCALQEGRCSPFLFPLNWKFKSVNTEQEKTVQFYFNGESLVKQSLTALEWNFSYFLKINGNQKWSKLPISWSKVSVQFTQKVNGQRLWADSLQKTKWKDFLIARNETFFTAQMLMLFLVKRMWKCVCVLVKYKFTRALG